METPNPPKTRLRQIDEEEVRRGNCCVILVGITDNLRVHARALNQLAELIDRLQKTCDPFHETK